MRYFFANGIADQNLSLIVASLPSYAQITQFTRSGFYWEAWGTYSGNREQLVNSIKDYCWKFEDRDNFLG